ncbi:RidA family protein [Halodesulfovibrio sp.]|uniref:RidA family protein n=1 Tax=Halodesulfovibrio sp. TaxID=1912772 RepID=UPI0025B82EE3|nr:RidA family protein [Halodesulfovibrio sp.]
MSTKNVIFTDQLPAAVGPYSQAIESDGFVFASGMLPIDPATGNMREGSIADRAHQALTNIKAVAEAAGCTLDDIVKTTVFLTDVNDFKEVNAVYAEYFNEPFPARSAFQVAALPLGADIEIEVIFRKKN